MAKEKKVEQITNLEDDFAQWYTDICRKAELVEYASVKGFTILRPYGYAIWENIQRIMDGMFKKTGHENVYLPMLIPESLLQKEKDHVEGFAPECAWVTCGGADKLEERYCIRPTSETLFCEHYKNIIHSHRDLPKLYNQWCSVVRWEKTTRPFLRSSEFLWQEGHTMHATAEEAVAETEQMLNIYADFMENVLAMPVVKGRKTDKEKFSGAEATYTVECMMHDKKALQGGTSHYFGDGFARAFGITFTGKDNQPHFPHQTSWGVSTRMIGGIIMTHGDDDGLILPPAVAPIQVVVVPIAAHKPGVSEKAAELAEKISKYARVKLDDSDNAPGWKFSQWEMKGVPARIEIGPRDIENGVVTVVRRDTLEKFTMPIQGIGENLVKLMADIHQTMYDMAFEHRKAHTTHAENFGDFMDGVKKGFVKAPWCADPDCEMEIKCVTGASTRCKPMDEDTTVKPGCKCVFCNREAKTMMYFARAY